VTPVTLDQRDGDYRANCGPLDDWTIYRTCPSGMIANQIKVHFRPENPAGFTTNIKQSATGIALVCRNVERR
jgi:hypothetical protein